MTTTTGTVRRIGTETSETRAALLDAAEQLMLAEGYAAVTSRRVAAQAGLKPQLVHYYFRTMDDLFLAVFRRRAEQGLERQADALASEQPLWSLWDLSRDPRGTALTMEFTALANHRKAIRAEIAASAERYRAEQLEGVRLGARALRGRCRALPAPGLHRPVDRRLPHAHHRAGEPRHVLRPRGDGRFVEDLAPAARGRPAPTWPRRSITMTDPLEEGQCRCES